MIRARLGRVARVSGVAVMMIVGMLFSAAGQESGQNLPLVIDGKAPLYPVGARAARIQGVVSIKVKIDGERVISLTVESGPPMLVRSAEENIRTWQFAKGKPATFVTIFQYVIEEPSQCGYTNGSSTLNLPTKVLIKVKGIQTCDPGR